MFGSLANKCITGGEVPPPKSTDGSFTNGGHIYEPGWDTDDWSMPQPNGEAVDANAPSYLLKPLGVW